MLGLQEILTARYNNREQLMPHRILVLDPGNTTGWCIFEDGKFTRGGQIDTIVEGESSTGTNCTINWNNMFNLLEEDAWDAVIIENYRIYSHKLDRHTFSEVPTLRLIGGIDAWCEMQQVKRVYQMATQAKGFVTDEKLTVWGLNKTHAFRHCADAIRHAIYYLVVTNLNK